MSFTGRVEAECPGCSETEVAEVWSFVRGDQDETLRDKVKSGDLNLVECPHCGRVFQPETSFVYADPAAGLLAFVFPASYGAEEERWRAKMREDYERMRPVAEQIGIPDEPLLFFGGDALGALIQRLEDLEDESEVGLWFGRKLGLSFARVAAGFARERELPRQLPFEPRAGCFSREGALRGLRRVLEANDRLEGYRRWISYLEAGGPEPPLGPEAP